MALKFRAGHLEFNATVAEASESPSPQTGDPRRTLIIQFRAQKLSMHEVALVEAEQRRTGGLFSLLDSGQPELEWRVRSSSFTYVGTEPWGINHHVWRIEQVERLACTRLVIGAISLEPHDYAEAISDSGIVRLVARGAISPSDLDALSLISTAVSVVRLGISDAPREMTISYLWSERSGGLAVVIRCVDVREPQLTLDESMPPDDVFGDIANLLRTKGVLDDEDIDHLRRQRHNARQVSTIEGWSLTEPS